ncbi:MAG TPA: carbonic anhydrase [Solirubrobacteraceae bacterium]|nr:carbonic anhydrase [Solirubrobacteraceae bacterium]
MSNAERMLAHAAAHAEDLAAPALGARPGRRVAVLSCMDTRIDLYALLGLARGDAHLLRNAGGLVTDDAIRSLAISQRLLGTEEVVVVMHERCGLLGADEQSFAAELRSDGASPAWRLGAFADVEHELRAGLRRLREAPELPHRDRIAGVVFDPETGSLRQVEV